LPRADEPLLIKRAAPPLEIKTSIGDALAMMVIALITMTEERMAVMVIVMVNVKSEDNNKDNISDDSMMESQRTPPAPGLPGRRTRGDKGD
jgi:hypothetical protein